MVAFATHTDSFETETPDMAERPIWDLEFDKDNALRLMQDAMAEKNLTQVQLANLLGVDQPRVNRWIKGKSVPRPATRRKIAEILELRLPGMADNHVLIPQLGDDSDVLTRAQTALLQARNEIDAALTYIAQVKAARA